MGSFDCMENSWTEFYLEDAVRLNRESPRTFLIPSKEEIDNLEISSLVKLIFVMKQPQKDGCRAERMWVKITEKQGDIFEGVLNNDPYFLKTIKYGDKISFRRENIASIYVKESPFDEKKFAIITKKALDNKQINWVTRSDELYNEQDSGWQLFFGDESPEYLDNADNATLISLEQVLSFEPLLETVFSDTGNAYEYSASSNSFVRVER